jgi:hypothetical protein
MRLGLFILAAMLLVACKQEPPRKPRFTGAQMQKLRAAEPGLKDECLEKIRWGGVEALTGDVEDCYKFDPPRHWKGLWFSGFEASRFCPEPARHCLYDTPGERIWLEASPSVRIPAYNGEAEGVLFQVNFIGRKTSYRGGYGHMGGSDQEVIVDRLLSMKRLGTVEHVPVPGEHSK